MRTATAGSLSRRWPGASRTSPTPRFPAINRDSGGSDGQVRRTHADSGASRAAHELRQRTAPAGASGGGPRAGGSAAGASPSSISSESQGGSQDRAPGFRRQWDVSLAVRSDRDGAMTSRAIARLRGFLLVLAATACGGHSGGGTGPSNKPVVQVGSNTPSLPVGTTYTLSATFSDTSNSSPWSYDIAWGDGQSATGTKTSISPITGTHTYATEGDY